MQLEMFDRRELKIEAVGGEAELRRLHGSRPCDGRCLGANPSSPCECLCSGVCHSAGRCILQKG